jgi:hypothetical protein
MHFRLDFNAKSLLHPLPLLHILVEVFSVATNAKRQKALGLDSCNIDPWLTGALRLSLQRERLPSELSKLVHTEQYCRSHGMASQSNQTTHT